MARVSDGMVCLSRVSPFYFIRSFNHLMTFIELFPSLHSNELAPDKGSTITIQEKSENVTREKSTKLDRYIQNSWKKRRT